MSYVAPRAEIVGSGLSRDDLAALLDPASGLSVADRLRRLSAVEISIPELTAEIAGPDGRDTTVYREVLLRNVGGGRIASTVASGGSIKRSGPVASSGNFGRFELNDADLALAFQIFNGASGSADTPLRAIYGSFSLSALQLSEGNGPTLRVARLSGSDFMARPTRDGWIATAAKLADDPSPEKPGAKRARLFGVMAELLGAFDIGTLEATGIDFTAPDGDGSGRVARLSYTGGIGKSGELRMEGFEGTGKDGRVRLAEVALGGVSLKPMLAAMQDLSSETAEALGPGELRRLVPTFGFFRLNGLDVDMAGTSDDKSKPTRFGIGTIELVAGKPLDAIPTELRVGMRNVSFEIGAAVEDESLKKLASLGYDRVDFTFAGELGWNEPGQEIVLRELSTRIQGVGAVTMRAVLGNVTKDVFSPDQALATVALVGAQAKSVDLLVEDQGLLDRLLASEAKEQGVSPSDLRRDMGMKAAIGIPILLGNSAAAKTLGQAVALFIAKPGRLSIQAQARPPGIGSTDFLASPDPTQLLERVDLSATVE